MIPFRKLHGCGNSFIVLMRSTLARQLSDAIPEKLAQHLCSPGFGIGSDGLVIVGQPEQGSVWVMMRNPDGSKMGMCGNALRCIPRYLVLEGCIAPDGLLRVDLEGLELSIEYRNEGRESTIRMPSPSFAPHEVPVVAAHPVIGVSRRFGTTDLIITCLSVGNPHCVTFCEDPDQIALEEIGTQIEHDPFFPNRTNVEFVQLVDRRTLRMRQWERGAGATLACGSGACAAVVAAHVLGKIDKSPIAVHCPGGVLQINWSEETRLLTLTGPACEICCGEISSENIIEGVG